MSLTAEDRGRLYDQIAAIFRAPGAAGARELSRLARAYGDSEVVFVLRTIEGDIEAGKDSEAAPAARRKKQKGTTK